jgi:hypothetical protein
LSKTETEITPQNLAVHLLLAHLLLTAEMAVEFHLTTHLLVEMAEHQMVQD